MQSFEKDFLLAVLLIGCSSTSGALLIRTYYDTEVNGVTSARRFPVASEAACQEACDAQNCTAWNMDPTKSICQFFELTSPTKKLFTCSRPVKVKMGSCFYELASPSDLCLALDYEPVTIESVAKGVRASCGDGNLLVFNSQDSIQPRFSNKSLDCETSGGWKYEGQVVGGAIRMGCTVKKEYPMAGFVEITDPASDDHMAVAAGSITSGLSEWNSIRAIRVSVEPGCEVSVCEMGAGECFSFCGGPTDAEEIDKVVVGISKIEGKCGGKC